MFNLFIFFAYLGMVFAALCIISVFKKDRKPVQKTYVQENDLPQWKPMSTLNKRSNKVLNQMYKGYGSNIEI